MKCSISNIGWTEEKDDLVYQLMPRYGFTGLEIAPTRIFPEKPYDKLEEAERWCHRLEMKYKFEISSMQSIWYGRQEKMFGTAEERQSLINYTKKAIDFAKTIGCKNLVFGCPRNRVVPEVWSQTQVDEAAIPFFKELGDYALEKGTVLAMEANPPIYNTNYMNDTKSALELIEKVDSKGFMLNLDVGTMIENNESVTELEGKACFINHVHISEPGLKLIKIRKLHEDLMDLLKREGYKGFVSLELSRQDDIEELAKMMKYLRNLA